MKLICRLILTCSFLSVPLGALADDEYTASVLPVLRDKCWGCHSEQLNEGELNLELYLTSESVRGDAEKWAVVLDKISLGEMPPSDAEPLGAQDRELVERWIRTTIREVALSQAGDPGPVVLRRLSNREYTYSIRDLTGVTSFDPTREFPTDGAAGEGFTNAGAALVMSPSLLQKYLDAARQISRHLVLLPDGIRFSNSDSPQDRTQESLQNIRQFYSRFTESGDANVTVQQGVELDLGAGSGRLPLAKYLAAIQHQNCPPGLSPKYHEILRSTMSRQPTGEPDSIILDQLRANFQKQTLNITTIEAWQSALWRFSTIGHIGRANGPLAWQEPRSPLVTHQELRSQFKGAGIQTLHLVAGSAGDGPQGDTIIWNNPRLVAAGQPDLPVAQLPELLEHLRRERSNILEKSSACLKVLAGEKLNEVVDERVLQLWREYLGLDTTPMPRLLTEPIARAADYDFVKGWTGANALSVLANSSDSTVKIPGTIAAHSVTMHPAPDQAAITAWKSPIDGSLTVEAKVQHAHPDCGNGVEYRLEIRRGKSVQVLAQGFSQGGGPIALGPFQQNVIRAGQLVALIILPRDGNHSCDQTQVDLKISDGHEVWELGRDVSADILAGNPHGCWHFATESTDVGAADKLPQSVIDWLNAPTAARAAQVIALLQQDFPLTHPLLQSSISEFVRTAKTNQWVVSAPATLTLTIPAEFAQGREFVVDASLATTATGSVQVWLRSQLPDSEILEAMPDAPILVGENSTARERWELSFAAFRQLFPIALCYERIVPVDEVVTLTLYHREDQFLCNLMLTDEEIGQLDRLWRELIFVSEAPLRQVDAYEQIYQFATQDRPDLVEEFVPLRDPTMRAAEAFREQQRQAEAAQRKAVMEWAARAWRRPLTNSERKNLESFAPRLMLVRVLTAPAFLYRLETVPQHTGLVNDWELATRLSYFLWSSVPDDELRQLAAAGQLQSPEILRSQIQRMLRDDRIRRLATEFGCQWLQVREVGTLDEKSERHFPTFQGVREDMHEEVTRYFVDLFQTNGQVVSLLESDHTFVNGNLAAHYGWELAGPDWQRVQGLRDQGRGGVLGFAAVLSKNSGASRSSAILRGTWVSEVLLGERLPNPPKGVPVLPEETPIGLTDRELIERHTQDIRCASCHRRIDPLGFALEGFDAIGRSRSAQTQTTLADGTAIDGLGGLRTYLVTHRRDDFLRQFSRKLLGYALGRSVQLSDQPLIERMMNAESQRVGDLIGLIVTSPQFRERRGLNIVERDE